MPGRPFHGRGLAPVLGERRVGAGRCDVGVVASVCGILLKLLLRRVPHRSNIGYQ